jgi:predicted DNA-binding transcriptional regulator AlpA
MATGTKVRAKRESAHLEQNENTFDTNGAGRYTGVSESALRLWRAQGEGPSFYRAGEKLVRYRKCDLDAWIEARLENRP